MDTLRKDVNQAALEVKKAAEASKIDPKDVSRALQACRVAVRKAQTWLNDDDHDEDALGGRRAMRALERASSLRLIILLNALSPDVASLFDN